MKKIPTTLLVVAAALLRKDGRILLQKRPDGRSMAGLWEFPGGKLEDGETPESALVREVTEELAITVDSANLMPACFASASVDDRPLLLMLYICTVWEGEPVAVESPELGWFSINEMTGLPMPPADIPLIDLLKKLI
jgi:8-oxo-dGTP diphosphatase